MTKLNELNQLRLLSGLPIDPKLEVTTKKEKLAEARIVPSHRRDLSPESDHTHGTRVDAVKRACEHVKNAIHALESVPALDFGGEIPHYISQLEELLTHDNGEGGLESLAKGYAEKHTKWKAGEAARVSQEQEEEDLSAGAADAVDHHDTKEELTKDLPSFEKGANASLHGEPVVVCVAEPGAEMVGVCPAGEEGNIDAIKLVHVTELEPAGEGEGDLDAEVDADLADTDVDADVGDEDVGGEEDLDDVEVSGLSIEPEHVPGIGGDEECEQSHIINLPTVKEGTKYYYDTEEEDSPKLVHDGNANADTVFKDVTAADAKEEGPRQIDNPGAASDDEMRRKVRVPQRIKDLLNDLIKDTEEGFKKLSNVQQDDHFFYNNCIQAYEQLLQHLEGGTVNDLKNAQIFYGTLMSPIAFKLPAEVVLFIAKGGATKSLKDYMKQVDTSKFPITGPRNVL